MKKTSTGGRIAAAVLSAAMTFSCFGGMTGGAFAADSNTVDNRLQTSFTNFFNSELKTMKNDSSNYATQGETAIELVAHNQPFKVSKNGTTVSSTGFDEGIQLKHPNANGAETSVSVSGDGLNQCIANAIKIAPDFPNDSACTSEDIAGILNTTTYNGNDLRAYMTESGHENEGTTANSAWYGYAQEVKKTPAFAGMINRYFESAMLPNRTLGEALSGVSDDSENLKVYLGAIEKPTASDTKLSQIFSDEVVETCVKKALDNSDTYTKYYDVNAKIAEALKNAYKTSSHPGGGGGTTTTPVLTTKVTLNDGTTRTVTENDTLQIPISGTYYVDFSSTEKMDQFNYTTGNGNTIYTGTKTKWNGTSGHYSVYAHGNIGDKTGVYINGKCVFKLQIIARPLFSDTTCDVHVEPGKTYVFYVKPKNAYKNYTFTTANGNVLQTSIVKGLYPDKNGRYFCRVKVTKKYSGMVGVYCQIDNMNYKLFAVGCK